MSAAVSTSRSDLRTHIVARWHATVEWYVGPLADGSSYTGWIDCPHDHMDQNAAEKCRGRLARRIELNPHLFPEVQHALDAAAGS